MEDNPILRIPRAAVFAAVCVLLAAIGHALGSRTGVPASTVAQAWCVVFAAAYALADRQRSFGAIAAFLLVAQGALHPWFQAAQIEHADARCASVVQLSPGLSVPQMCGNTMPSWAVSSLMLGVYALVALACAWWLRRGEAAVFGLARFVVDRGRALIAFAALLLGFAPVAVPYRRARACPDLCGLRLPAAGVFLPVVRRGPPRVRAFV
jgi:hypothetical protein